MVPRLFPGWLGAVVLVPLLVCPAVGIEGDDDAAIVVSFVVDYRADGPFAVHRMVSFD